MRTGAGVSEESYGCANIQASQGRGSARKGGYASVKSREVGACSLFPDPAAQLQTQAWLAFSLQTRFSPLRGKVNPEHGFSPRPCRSCQGLGRGVGVAVAWAKGDEASVLRTRRHTESTRPQGSRQEVAPLTYFSGSLGGRGRGNPERSGRGREAGASARARGRGPGSGNRGGRRGTCGDRA